MIEMQRTGTSIRKPCGIPRGSCTPSRASHRLLPSEDELKKALLALDPEIDRSMPSCFWRRSTSRTTTWLTRKRSVGKLSPRIRRALPPERPALPPRSPSQGGDRARAEEVLRQASKDFVADPQGVRILADYYVSSGQMDKAEAEFSSLAAKYPESVSLQKGYIRVLLEVKDYGTARTVVDRLMKTHPRDPEVAGYNGIVLLNSGKVSDAVGALQRAVKDAPKDAFLQYWLGTAALANGDIDLAEKSLRQAANLNPSRLEAAEKLARIALQRGDIDLLANVADKTIAAMPRFPGGYVWRAIVEMDHNALDKAEADLKTAISIAPQTPQAYFQLGTLRFAQKRFPEGVSLLEQGLRGTIPNFFRSP